MKQWSKNMFRRTKIVATVGPSSDNSSLLHDFIDFGVEAFRINMSHGDYPSMQNRIENLRNYQRKLQKEITIFADLQGPKMRLGDFVDAQVYLDIGDSITLDLDCDSAAGTKERVWMDCAGLVDSVQSGSILLLDDGKMHLQVQYKTATSIVCTVLTQGVLASRKGISLQGGGLKTEVFTAKDKQDLQQACAWGVDFVAVSFPACHQDILTVRQYLDDIDPSVGIIAKIERKDAIENLNDIIKVADVVMVARGDLALEVGDAEVPILQKHIIKSARSFSKPVIVATHMMESMITSPKPTRAEVSDVANAILDGADAVMLSAETACGEYPFAVIEHVDAICRRIEQHPRMQGSGMHEGLPVVSTRQAVAHMAMGLANNLDLRCVVSLTISGTMPCWLSRICSGIPIYAFAKDARVRAKMLLLRDVFPISFTKDLPKYGPEILQSVVATLLDEQKIDHGESFLFIHGEGDSHQPISDILCVHRVQQAQEYAL